MSAKIIQVSEDDVTYYTLPGSTGEISVEAAEVSNSIFGQEYESSIGSLFSYSFSANAWLRKTPGFNATIKSASTATAIATPEAMTLVSGKTYKITDATKNFWDATSTFTFADNAVALTGADIESIDYMFGTVTLAAAYTVTGPITATVGSFFTLAAIGCANSVDLSQGTNTQGNTCFNPVGGYAENVAGTKTVSMSLSGLYRTANDFFGLLESRVDNMIEIDWEGDGLTLTRGIFRATTYSQSGDQSAGQDDYSIDFGLSTPEDIVPFDWYFAPTSNAPAGLKAIINSWIEQKPLYFKYYPKGADAEGYSGSVIVDDASMSVSVEAIGELSLSGTGTGPLVELI